MDSQDIRSLKILEETENGQLPSQRYLAGKLDVSLGLVNSFIKRLVNKGYFKIANVPASRVSYILTPAGAAEKSRLALEYIQYSFKFYRESRKRLQAVFSEMAEKKNSRVVFFQASELAEIAYISMKDYGLQLVAVADDAKNGKSFLGREIGSSGEIADMSFDWFFIAEAKNIDQAIEQVKLLGVPARKIATLTGLLSGKKAKL